MGQKTFDILQPSLSLDLVADFELWQGQGSTVQLQSDPNSTERSVDLLKGMAGAMKALQSTGILDCCTYSVGLSGTGWMAFKTAWKQNRILPIY